MPQTPTPSGITIISAPYHVGLRHHRVGNGPPRLLAHGLINALQDLGLTVHTAEIPPVDAYEGEIGRSFEIMRRISLAVTAAVEQNTFPLILSGNCMASVGAACGLNAAKASAGSTMKDLEDEGLGFIYFDAHDDLDSPDVHENGYLDAMGLSMLRGESWKALSRSIPGYKPLSYDQRFLYVGLRDQSPVQRQRVINAGMDAIWGRTDVRVDYVSELKGRLQKDAERYAPSLVHLDLDVLDESLGKVNDYPSPGGLFEEELVGCLDLVPRMGTRPRSLTVCSFDPDAGDGDGDRIAKIGVRAVVAFCRAMVESGGLVGR
ncbi:hypothetical protein BDW74DRAFT_173747 [Aspergillus multicolor]|uniref:arginase family protein n=1 Tax=Aspergillus multicolor TaxID=41759 RepID=UPI003CCE3246